MTQTANFVAADLGASSVRIMLGQWNGESFSLRELHRFANGGIRAGSGLYWDILGIWSQIRTGLAKYPAVSPEPPQGIAIDAWGVDFGLLDRNGELIANPRHYRDSRTNGIPPHLFKRVAERAWFKETGVQAMPINTLFQLHSMALDQQPLLAAAETMLMIPDLCTYLLCGEKVSEWSEASTTQMYSLREKDWARAQLNAARIPVGILPPVVQPGTALSSVRSDVLAECGFSRPFPAIAVGSHDTASAVAAIPDMSEESVFLSSGTWSLMGVEATAPDTSDEAFRLGFTNEGSAAGGVLLLKNLTGLWIVQECMRQWSAQGRARDWFGLLVEAEAATSFRCFIDPDAQCFQAPGNMQATIREYCRMTGQSAPETDGEFARCAFESLSLKYRSVLDSLRKLTGRALRTIRVVGGGGMNSMLCQMTADACRCEVFGGPAEASTLGNVMLQAVATGHLSDVSSGREAIARSVKVTVFEPHQSDRWDVAYARFRALEANGITVPAR